MVKKSAGKAAAPAPAVTKATKKAAAKKEPIIKKPKAPAKAESESSSNSESDNTDSGSEEEEDDDEEEQIEKVQMNAQEDSDAEPQENKKTSSGTGRTMEEMLQDVNTPSSSSYSTSIAVSLKPTTASSSLKNKYTTPKAADLQQTFLQALQSADQDLIDACLHFTSPVNVIRNTVHRIATIYVTPLLTSILTQYQQKPNQNLHLIEWIRSILLIHSTFLMNNQELVEKLSRFYRIVEARMPVSRKIMSLSGRLDMIMNQIEMRRQYENDENDDEVVYVEDEEHVEEEDLDHTGAMEDDDDDDELVGEADAFDEENGDTDEEELESDISDDDDVSDDE
ncbi:hypothetical protein FBU30_003630 [Linnemannia zychae]|nr:hypothetical protein FBU30_003630 [Linnemannia zychae]